MNDPFEYWRRVGRHVRPRRFAGWFLGVNLPIAVGLSAFIAWHSSIVGEADGRHIFLRAVIGLIAFGGGLSVFWWKALRPAMRAAEENEENTP
jgi:hypothetical protein